VIDGGPPDRLHSFPNIVGLINCFNPLVVSGDCPAVTLSFGATRNKPTVLTRVNDNDNSRQATTAL
jgi:hypothetical protein